MVTRRTVVKSTVAVPFVGGALLAASPAWLDRCPGLDRESRVQGFHGTVHPRPDVHQDSGRPGNLRPKTIPISVAPRYAQQALVTRRYSPLPGIHRHRSHRSPGPDSVDDALGWWWHPGGVTRCATPAATQERDASQAVLRSGQRQQYLEQFGLVWLEAVTGQQYPGPGRETRNSPKRMAVTTISQLAEIVGDLMISAPADFRSGKTASSGLQRVLYGGGI